MRFGSQLQLGRNFPDFKMSLGILQCQCSKGSPPAHSAQRPLQCGGTADQGRGRGGGRRTGSLAVDAIWQAATRPQRAGCRRGGHWRTRRSRRYLKFNLKFNLRSAAGAAIMAGRCLSRTGTGCMADLGAILRRPHGRRGRRTVDGATVNADWSRAGGLNFAVRSRAGPNWPWTPRNRLADKVRAQGDLPADLARGNRGSHWALRLKLNLGIWSGEL